MNINWESKIAVNLHFFRMTLTKIYHTKISHLWIQRRYSTPGGHFMKLVITDNLSFTDK